MEIWKKINGFENYEISNLGNVKRVECTITYSNGIKCKYKEKLLKFDFNRKNKREQFYKRVTLSQNNTQRRFQVHRLVAECFIPNPLNKKFINHVDGNPENNRVDNLEWCTSSENEKHSYKVLGKINNNRKLSDNDVLFILKNAVKGNYIKGSGNIDEIAEKLKVCKKVVLNVLNKKHYVSEIKRLSN